MRDVGGNGLVFLPIADGIGVRFRKSALGRGRRGSCLEQSERRKRRSVARTPRGVEPSTLVEPQSSSCFR